MIETLSQQENEEPVALECNWLKMMAVSKNQEKLVCFLPSVLELASSAESSSPHNSLTP